MSVEKIIGDWKKNIYKPIYWLEGEEEFYIDIVMQHAEHHILSPTDSEFNLSIFYGKDANWADVLNACRRYPMFSTRQVVLLKEAQQMKDLDKLEPYISNPLSSTVFVISYKGKLDRRMKIAKAINLGAEVLISSKIPDYKLSAWANDFVDSRGFRISPRALMLLVGHIGTDLSRIVNEFEKVLMNLAGRKDITEDDISSNVGISKEYNVFELQQALSHKDLAKAITIIQYFESNPKAAPIQMILPALYNHFSKVMTVFQMTDRSEKALKPFFYYNSFAVKEGLATMKNYSHSGVENALLLLHAYNLKSVGINNPGISDASLMKELAVKIIGG